MSTPARSSITDAHELELRSLAARVLPLLAVAKEDDRSILDYLVGAIHALVRARELKFRNRSKKLSENYWKQGPTHAAQTLKDGALRMDGPWLAGFYFNSSLARTAATLHRFIGVAQKAKHGKARKAVGPDIKHCCPKAVLVAKEVDRLKHEPPGVAPGRLVNANDAVVALREVVTLAEQLI